MPLGLALRSGIAKDTPLVQESRSYSWREDEAYIKVEGKRKYLSRAIEKDGDTLDFSCP
ncbi:DDE-type integrase/transposase/recombinase [Kiloniella litopenaei]|uniref:DDE-type integrase/transposase/recombinase n=1 Tax=Kiloniella litopenaei TaxID=1549748 RepID=UPI0009E42DB1